MTETEQPDAAAPKTHFGREFGAGLFLLAIAAFAVWGAWPLAFGQLSGIGSGLMPKSTAVITAGFGALLIAQSLISGSAPLEPWSVRGVVLVLGAIALFAATIRPLGLAFAGPSAILVASLADPSTRAREIIPFALILTALSIALFKFALRLPIPLAPPLLGY